MAEAWEGWYTVGIMFCCFVALMKNVAGPDVLMLGSLAMMLAADAVDIPEGLKGFSNKGPSSPIAPSVGLQKFWVTE